MHMTRMILEHIALCKASEFVFRKIWNAVKTAIQLATALFLLKGIVIDAMKTADAISRGFAFLLFLMACGVISSTSFRIAPATE